MDFAISSNSVNSWFGSSKTSNEEAIRKKDLDSALAENSAFCAASYAHTVQASATMR